MDELLLLQELYQNNEKAYTTLYTYYQPRLFRFALPLAGSNHLADEIVQDVLVKLWIKREALVGILSLEKYLIRMVRNQLLDYRKLRKTQEKHHRQLTPPESDPLSLENDFSFKEYQILAQEAIRQLPEKRRQAFELWSSTSLSIDEIAEQLNISKAGVQKHLVRSAHYIKEYLKTHGEWYTVFISLILNLLK